MMTNHLLIRCLLSHMKIFNMVHHVRNAAKGARPLLVWNLLIPNTNYTLGPLTQKGKFIRLWEGIGSGNCRLETTLACEFGTLVERRVRSQD